MPQYLRWCMVAVAIATAGITLGLLLPPEPAPVEPIASRAVPGVTQQLFDIVQPVPLANCDLARFGDDHDGGYLMCGNLLRDVQIGYSYGIGGTDGWGCEIATTLDVPVHQYDCFDLRRPACPGADMRFHEECVGGTRQIADGRLFDTIPGQIAANGDDGKRLVLKIDVEGAEWEALLSTPDELLRQVEQMAVEFHGIDQTRFIAVVAHLRRLFYVAHLHYNNNACSMRSAPFSAWVYEMLFVNKRLAIPDETRSVARPHPLDMPNNRHKSDCQGPPPMS